MLQQRLQILVSVEQRRRLEAEAKRRGASVASLIREAVDAHFGALTSGERLAAVDEIRAMSGKYVSPDGLDEIVESERDEQFPVRAR